MFRRKVLIVRNPTVLAEPIDRADHMENIDCLKTSTLRFLYRLLELKITIPTPEELKLLINRTKKIFSIPY